MSDALIAPIYADILAIKSRVVARVAAPSIVEPANGATGVGATPVLRGSAFRVSKGAIISDTHLASRWQVRLASGSWSTVLHDSGETYASLTEYAVPSGVVHTNTQYAARVQYRGANLGWSEWSDDVVFTTKSQFASIIGLVQVATGGGAGQYQRIDENFSPVSRDAAWFNNHPVYAGIVAQVVDGQRMVKIPRFYYMAGTVPSGVYAGKTYWMISDQPVAGFSVHPAFIGAGGAQLNQVWVGGYQASYDGSSKMQSVAGAMPMVSMDFPTARQRAYARNTGGVTGFREWSAYDLSAIQMLMSIEIGRLDVQAMVGQGRVAQTSAAAVDAADVAQATWRGIVGLWGNVWQMVDGLKRRGGTWWRWQYNAPGSATPGDFTTGYINTGVPALSTSGYPVTFDATMLATAGLFVPASVDGLASNGSTGDYFWSNTSTDDRVLYHGGSWGHGADAGLVCASADYAPSNAHSTFGARLAKV